MTRAAHDREGSRSSLEQTAADPDLPSAERPETGIERGDRVGRYVIIDRLGAGAMGVVYAAYDPELDRKLALKLLLSPGGESSIEGRQRLIREAKAMAQLSHPNVVTVHDVGEHGRGVFVAMELIDGITLRAWLDAEARDWRSVLRVFLAAGQGLVAAHEAQLIHRDFKPENVMVGRDGRVRVLDFGLVRALADRGSEESFDGSSQSEGSPQQTRLGTILGTPAYMSPEQLRSEVVDAASDQFSFCVALYEGLYGERPFAGTSLVELAGNVMTGNIRAAPRRSSVPGWLRQLISTGLEQEPSERHRSLGVLLTALGADPSRMRRRLWGAASLAGLAAAIWGGMVWSEARTRAHCDEEGDAISSEWGSEARASVKQALLAHEASFAEETWQRVEAGLDRYVADWGEARTLACVAHEVEGRWTKARERVALGCLAERRAAMESLVSVLSEPDLEVLLHADTAMVLLPEIERCVDEAWLAERRAGQVSESVRGLELREEATRAEIVWRAGRVEEGRARLETALEEARGQADLETIATLERALARVLVWQGEYQAGLEVARLAYFAWGELADDRVQRELATRIAGIEAEQGGRLEVARVWLGHARMLHARLGGVGGEPWAPLSRAEAILRTAEGDYEAAIVAVHEALALAEQENGPDHPSMIPYRIDVADIEQRRGNYEIALKLSVVELDRARRVRGEHHPQVARALTNVAILQVSLGQLDEGEATAREAVALSERALGRSHRLTAVALQSLASVLSKRGEFGEAVALLERVVAIEGSPKSAPSTLGGVLVRDKQYGRAVEVLEAAYEEMLVRHGPDHPDLLSVLINLGAAHSQSGDDERRRWAYTEAIRVGEATLPADHPMLSYPLHNLGMFEQEQGNLERSREFLERALEIRTRKLGADHPITSSTLAGLAKVDLAEGQPEVAIEGLEQALRILRAKGAYPDRQAEIRFDLAQAMVAAERPFARARTLAEAARDGFAAQGDEEAEAAAIAWLAELEAY